MYSITKKRDMLFFDEYKISFLQRGVFMDWRLSMSIIVVIASLAGLFFAVKNKKPKAGWIATLIMGIYGAIVFSI